MGVRTASRRTRRLAEALLLLLVGTAACGGRTDLDGDVSSPADFLGRLRLLAEERDRYCCGLVAARAPSGPAELPVVTDAAVIDPIAARTCFEQAHTMQCEARLPEACYRALVGTVQPGDPCRFDAECAPVPAGDAVCDRSGVCVARVHGRSGDRCTSTCRNVTGSHEAECAPSYTGELATCWPEEGLACIDGACATPVSLGASCEAGQCASDAWCHGGECQPLRSEGDACSATYEDCKSGLACRAGRCIARKQHGARCSDDDECAGFGCLHGRCVASDFAFQCVWP